MKEKNIITPIIFVIFIVFITNMGTITVAKQFDWIIFIVSMSLNIVGICIDINIYKLTHNAVDVMKEKRQLNKILDSKKDRLDEVVSNIKNSRNQNILLDIHIYTYDIMDKPYNLDYIKNSISNGTLINNLKTHGIKNKKLKLIKKLLKMYDYSDDVEDIISDYKLGNLLKKEKVNVIASVTGTIGFIITILGFFKFDYQSINMSVNLVFVFIVFVINIIGSVESYFKSKKFKIHYYKKLQSIFDREKVFRY